MPPEYDHPVPLSPRQALIHVSEAIKKPQYGNDYFGKAAAQECQRRGSALAVFSDGGFPEEIGPLQDAFENVVIFRLSREGCSFQGDSRNYLEGFLNMYDLPLVTGEPDRAIVAITTILEDYLPCDVALPLAS